MNKTKNILLLVVILVFSPINAHTYEVLEVCATYNNTNKKYKVQGNVYKGQELNDATSSYEYDSYAQYVVIFWSNEQATIIKMDSSYGNFSFGKSGKDQNNRKWTIRRGHDFCL